MDKNYILRKSLTLFLLLITYTVVNGQSDGSKEYINVKDYGAIPNDGKDDSRAIQNALNNAYDNHINKVFMPAGVYTLDHGISINIGCKLYANSTDSYLDFTNCKDSMAVTLLHYKTDIRKFKILVGTNIALENLYLLGTNKSPFSDPVIYHKGLTALNFKSAFIGIKNCIINGFDNTTKFESHSYIITLENCSLSFNNVGFSFDYNKYTDLGERILLSNCTIGNNNYGIFNNRGFINIDNSSIDYNKIQIRDNVTMFGGQNRGALRIYNSHIEGNSDDKNVSVINNHGSLSISNSNILFGEPNGSNYINNQGELYLSLCSINAYSPNYLVKGNLPNVSQVSYLSSSEVQKIHPKLSLVNGYTANNLKDMWKLNGCVQTSAIKQIAKIQTVNLSNDAMYVSPTKLTASLISTSIPINENNDGNFSLTYNIRFVNKSNKDNYYSSVTFYNALDREIKSYNITVFRNGNTSDFLLGQTGSQKIPQGSKYCKINFNLDKQKDGDIILENLYLIRL